MNTIASLITLCAIGIVALAAVSLVNQRQIRAKRARQKVKLLKFRVDALEELAIVLDGVVDTRRIAKCIHNEALELLGTMRKLDPSAHYLDASIRSAEKLSAELSDEYGERAVSRMKSSDAQIARTQQAINEAARILRQQKSRGQLADSELDDFLRELSWLTLQVEINSLIGQGLLAMKKNDIIGAFTFYKRAQNCLIQSDESDPRRQRLIKELNEMLGKRRSYPSHDLMPEAAAIMQDSGTPKVASPTIDVMDESPSENLVSGIDSLND